MPAKKSVKSVNKKKESKRKKECINNSKKYVANTYARFDLVLASGKDAKL